MTNPVELLIQEAEALKSKMQYVSDEIRKVEALLTNLKVNFPYLGEIDRTEELYSRLAWENNNKSGNWWLTYGEKTGDKVWVKKLIDCPIEIRLKCLPHLPKFIEAYAKYIREKRMAIEQQVDRETKTMN